MDSDDEIICLTDNATTHLSLEGGVDRSSTDGGESAIGYVNKDVDKDMEDKDKEDEDEDDEDIEDEEDDEDDEDDDDDDDDDDNEEDMLQDSVAAQEVSAYFGEPRS